MIDDSPVIVKASINSTTLLNARDAIIKMGLIDDNGYPDVRNRNGFIDTCLKFMRIDAEVDKAVKGEADEEELDSARGRGTHDGSAAHACRNHALPTDA